jgi:XRE family aerobic/anaerobic benzoate catabolism transcriptional regulator
MVTDHTALLRQLGDRVRALRDERGLSRKELARASGLSPRFLAALETGDGNISVARLADLARALGSDPAALLGNGAEQTRAGVSERPVVTLLGLRGAGKSSVGRALSKALGRPFQELDQLIEAEAGMPLGSIFEFHGESYYRRLEREALAQFLVDRKPAVLAAGGGIVTDPRSLELIRRHTLSVWLKARPHQHWDRVVAQGDLRPMAHRSNALAELQELLLRREPLYARAHLSVDTSELSVEQSVQRILQALAIPQS